MNTSFYIKAFIGASLLCLACTPWAQADFGKSGWVIFKKNQTSAFRSLAATSPFAENLEGSVYNPALLGSLTQAQVLTAGELGANDDKSGSLIAGFPWHEQLFAVGAMYFDAGSMDLNWIESGQVQSETVAAERDFLGFISYAYAWRKNFRTGLAVKAARSELVQRQSALAIVADAGLFYEPAPGWTLSLAVNNLGGSSKFVDEQAPLPSTLFLGSGYFSRWDAWRLGLSLGALYNSTDEKTLPEAGLEFGYSLLALQAGYRPSANEGQFHFGLGLDWQNLLVQYAYEPGIYLDAVHRLTLGYRFGQTAPTATRIVKNTSEKPVPAAAPAPSSGSVPSAAITAEPKPAPEVLPPLVGRIVLKKHKHQRTLSWNPPSGEGWRFNVYLKSNQGPWVRQNTQPLKAHTFTFKPKAKNRRYSVMIKTVDPQGKENKGTTPQEIKF